MCIRDSHSSQRTASSASFIHWTTWKGSMTHLALEMCIRDSIDPSRSPAHTSSDPPITPRIAMPMSTCLRGRFPVLAGCGEAESSSKGGEVSSAVQTEDTSLKGSTLKDVYKRQRLGYSYEQIRRAMSLSGEEEQGL